ncbi:MAG: hypothetical protein JXA39_04275 [Bacteroidales bacterium]|nr:hypothetical protein [Bacteroidales bacterium]
MKNIVRSLTILLVINSLIMSCAENEEQIKQAVPSLDELAGVWMSADTADMEPSVRNFRGQALLNRDLASISWFVSAPYSGGYHTGVLRVNGKTPGVSMFRWLPHQAIRKGTLDGWKLFSTVKMVPDDDVILWQVHIVNDSTMTREIDLSLDMIGFISKYGGDWQWWYPYPKLEGATTIRDDEVENVRKHIGSESSSSRERVVELIDGKPTPTDKTATWPSTREILNAEKYRASLQDGVLVISDRETDAVTAFRPVMKPDTIVVYNAGGTADWKRVLRADESITIEYVMTFGDDAPAVREKADSAANNFETLFNTVADTWNERWNALFEPGNTLISGCFPVLETDDPKVRKVYYTGPLTMLYLVNNHLPQHEKVFLTGGPRWGASISFFWDITEWATLWAVVDPAMMKEHLSAWIRIDPAKHYGKDNFGGKGVGNGYSANYWALFQLVRAYITVSRDFDFLSEQVGDKTVLEHLDHYANNWKNLSPFLQKGEGDKAYNLADFGDDEWNLLECVPTYKHIVPSFNAGYIWMMRELAGFYELTGESQKASDLRHEADAMVDRLLMLYAGDGVWYSLYPDNQKIEVRHSLDFMFLGRYIPGDIPERTGKEMIDFLYRELMTNHWMRAQSLRDVAAEQSDRADHGPLGAFDGWPAGTMDALSQMGYPGKALDFYRAIEPVTYEGCWAQAHELWGEHKLEKNARVRIAERGWHNRESSSGIAMSQVMLKCFFGFYPDIQGNPLMETTPPDFEGKLYHVYYGGAFYTLRAKSGKVKMIKERRY